MVLQKAVLFKGTIADNLRWGKEDATEEEMDEALMISQAKEFVDNKVGRLEFGIEQGGRNLSGGQKKRAALCKVLLQKPDILILDEPTSGLDPLMQNKFVELIHKAKKEGKTILMSSHIFEEVEHTCDRVVIIKEGEIVATEKMEDLRHSRRKYYEICFHDVKEATLFHQQYPESQVRDTVVSLSLQGSADTLIKALSQYTIDDLSVRVQSLEELFLHYYGGNQS